jgi:hypothetical protein
MVGKDQHSAIGTLVERKTRLGCCTLPTGAATSCTRRWQREWANCPGVAAPDHLGPGSRKGLASDITRSLGIHCG